MSKPFTLAFVEGVTEAPCKPGWHKRALAAERAAAVRRITTAPQHGNVRADAKAIDYARWIAARDGIGLPGKHAPRVAWEACAAGMRPRSVVFGQPGNPVVIELPHWSYVAPEVVAVELLPWAPPVVTERPAGILAETLEAPPAIMDAAPLPAADVPEALAFAYPEPVEAELSGTFEAGTLIFAATIVSPDLNVPPVEAIQAPAPVEGRSEVATAPCTFVLNGLDGDAGALTTTPSEAIEAAPCPATESDIGPDLTTGPADDWRPTAESHPIVALCLSPAAANALFDRVLDGTFRAAGRTAKGGAWRLTVEDARACADIPSLRLVGMPRRPYPRRAAAPVEAIPVVEIRTGLAAMPPAAMAGAAPRPIVYHSPA